MTLAELKAAARKMLPEFTNYPDRALAIVAAAYLDDMIRELLRARLINDASAVKRAFDFAPLGRAEARIRMAYLVGLLEPDVRDTLLMINTIRMDSLTNTKPRHSSSQRSLR